MNKIVLLLDRTGVLFIGLVFGLVIGLSFGTQGQPWRVLTGNPADAPVAAPGDMVALAGKGGGMTAAPATADRIGDTPALSDRHPTPTPMGSNAADTVLAAYQPAPGCGGAALLSGNVANALRQGRQVQVGVFGDSFGEGFWAATYNALLRDRRFAVHGFAKQSTGFTRYRTLNLLEDTAAKLSSQPIDLAIISYGANDTQGIYADGHLAPYMSASWQKIVGDRAAALVHLLQSRGAVVVWVGLPIMRSADFDRQTRAMNAFYSRQMCALGVRYINTLPASLDTQGQFNTYLQDPGTGDRFQARAMDGIHMSMKGYRRLLAPLLHDMQALGAAPAPLQLASTGTPPPPLVPVDAVPHRRHDAAMRTADGPRQRSPGTTPDKAGADATHPDTRSATPAVAGHDAASRDAVSREKADTAPRDSVARDAGIPSNGPAAPSTTGAAHAQRDGEKPRRRHTTDPAQDDSSRDAASRDARPKEAGPKPA